VARVLTPVLYVLIVVPCQQQPNSRTKRSRPEAVLT